MRADIPELPALRRPFIAEMLSQMRAHAGLSQDELAERCQLTQSTISRYEHDDIIPSVIRFATLAEACGFDVSVTLQRSN